METKAVKIGDRDVTYQIVNGTYYHAETSAAVVNVLEQARRLSTGVRIHYGDVATGKDWMEENDMKGRIGRSMGPVKVPLLIARGDDGGGAILDHCIVRVRATASGAELYRHPAYHQPKLELVTETSPTAVQMGYKFAVHFDGVNHASFKTTDQRDKYLAGLGIIPQTTLAAASNLKHAATV